MRRATILAWLILLLSPSGAVAECELPEEGRWRRGFAIASNTVGPGIVNSAVGLVFIAGSMLVAPFSDRVHLPRFARSRSGLQLSVQVSDDWNSWGTSLGIFLIEKRDLEDRISEEDLSLHALHEGGHAYQSALLGPFYLPVVGLDYAIHGGGGHDIYFRHGDDRGGLSENPDGDAWVERWADSMAVAGGARSEWSSREIAGLVGCPVKERLEHGERPVRRTPGSGRWLRHKPWVGERHR